MAKQKVPDIDFGFFTMSEIPELFKDNKIYINPAYQRGSIWKPKQKIELIRSIDNSYSIGVLVLYINDAKQYEILDGQQRLLAIRQYMEDKMDLTDTGMKKYGELNKGEKALLDAYCVYYLKLKSHNPETKEEDIVQTFLRLQEGTPLNKAEKVNAHRGEFKNTFMKFYDTHPIFGFLDKKNEKRFRLRLLAAEILLLELESDFDNKRFPALTIDNFLSALEKKESISEKKIKFITGNFDLLNSSLNLLVTGLEPRDFISLYLLISYLRKVKADNSKLIDEFRAFSEDFLHNLELFSINDTKPPKNMAKWLFEKYKNYKSLARQATSPESLKVRFEFILSEFERMHPFIKKDAKRLHDIEQKRTLFFRQKGTCPECKKPLDFRNVSSELSTDHTIPHKAGGKTDDLEHAVLYHKRCHEKVEKRRRKQETKK